MVTIMAVVTLLSFVALIVGLIKPSAVLGFTKKKTRWRVLLIYGAGLFPALFVVALVGQILNPTPIQSSPPPLVSERKQEPKAQDSKGGSILYNMIHDKPAEQPSPPQYASTDFDEYDRYLGIDSSLTDMQKDEFFNSKVKESFIKWTGRVVEISDGVLGGPQIQLQHIRGPGTPDVFLELRPEEKSKALQVRKGQTITYSGKVTFWGKRSRYQLDEGVILEIH